MKFSEFVEINPKIGMKMNEEYPYIDMKSIVPGERFISSKIRKKFNGNGSKFQNKDILFARITPCLENGKIAQYTSINSKPSFGSTEFIIFRAKENLVNTSYLYYLCYSPIIRKTAEKSMVGASGRQRARLESIKDVNIKLPNLMTQKKIAVILSAYDELIENNNRRIEILEEMAETIYKEWFVYFRFPGHEKVKMVDSELGKIPEGWRVKTIKEVLSLEYGKSLPKKNRKAGDVPVYGSSGFLGYHNTSLVDGPGIIVGRAGNAGQVHWVDEDFYPVDSTFYVKILDKNVNLFFIFYALQSIKIVRLSSSAAVPGVNRNAIYNRKIVIPSLEDLLNFDKNIYPIFSIIYTLKKKNLVLKKSQDLLLPKLISGTIDVSDLDIKIEELK